MADGNVRFIRVNGRVVPIKAKGAQGEKAIKKYGMSVAKYDVEKTRKNTAGERFSRGMVGGAAIGAVAGSLAGAAKKLGRSKIMLAGGAGAAGFGLALGALTAALGKRTTTYNQEKLNTKLFRSADVKSGSFRSTHPKHNKGSEAGPNYAYANPHRDPWWKKNGGLTPDKTAQYAIDRASAMRQRRKEQK